jgi:hypothetical protein
VVSDAIAAGNVHAINYFVANNYVKALTELAKAPNQKVLMMPIDASGVIGSIAGIAEITREAFGGLNGASPTGAKPGRAVPSVPTTKS